MNSKVVQTFSFKISFLYLQIVCIHGGVAFSNRTNTKAIIELYRGELHLHAVEQTHHRKTSRNAQYAPPSTTSARGGVSAADGQTHDPRVTAASSAGSAQRRPRIPKRSCRPPPT